MTALVIFAQDFQDFHLVRGDRFVLLEAPRARRGVNHSVPCPIVFTRPTIRAHYLNQLYTIGEQKQMMWTDFLDRSHDPSTTGLTSNPETATTLSPALRDRLLFGLERGERTWPGARREPPPWGHDAPHPFLRALKGRHSWYAWRIKPAASQRSSGFRVPWPRLREAMQASPSRTERVQPVGALTL